MKINPRCKLWLENEDGEYIIGKGGAALLGAIEELGSIRAAAESCGMSYNYAWGMIKDIEKNLGQAVVDRKRGGKDGGESQLTERGRELLSLYQSTKRNVENCMGRIELK